MHTSQNDRLRPFDADQAQIARRAFRRYGKGRHSAGLNYGDCFSYALAKATGEPLLFKRVDFARTDVEAVVLRGSRCHRSQRRFAE